MSPKKELTTPLFVFHRQRFSVPVYWVIIFKMWTKIMKRTNIYIYMRQHIYQGWSYINTSIFLDLFVSMSTTKWNSSHNSKSSEGITFTSLVLWTHRYWRVQCCPVGHLVQPTVQGGLQTLRCTPFSLEALVWVLLPPVLPNVSVYLCFYHLNAFSHGEL